MHSITLFKLFVVTFPSICAIYALPISPNAQLDVDLFGRSGPSERERMLSALETGLRLDQNSQPPQPAPQPAPQSTNHPLPQPVLPPPAHPPRRPSRNQHPQGTTAQTSTGPSNQGQRRRRDVNVNAQNTVTTPKQQRLTRKATSSAQPSTQELNEGAGPSETLVNTGAAKKVPARYFCRQPPCHKNYKRGKATIERDTMQLHIDTDHQGQNLRIDDDTGKVEKF